jgi:hypothetical protein
MIGRKKVWLTWMPADEGAHHPQSVVRLLGQYGFEVTGGEWVDDLPRMQWLALGAALLETTNADLWLIAGDVKSFAMPSNRYALSLLTATVREGRGEGFPILGLGLDAVPGLESLPTLMRSLQYFSATDQGWPAKLVAAAFRPTSVQQPDFRLGVWANPLFGQWFEVGPRGETWAGVMFGVTAEGTITHHAVGPKGQVPERAVLEYPVEGMQAQVRDTAFTAWSVQNALGPDDSYYVKVEGFPAMVVFGGHPGTDQAEVVVIELK